MNPLPSPVQPLPASLADSDLARFIAEAERAPEAYFALNSRSFSFAARLFPDAARQVVPAPDDRTVGPAAAVHPAPPDPTAPPS